MKQAKYILIGNTTPDTCGMLLEEVMIAAKKVAESAPPHTDMLIARIIPYTRIITNGFTATFIALEPEEKSLEGINILQPNWIDSNKGGKLSWIEQVPKEVRDIWDTFSFEQKKAVAYMAQRSFDEIEELKLEQRDLAARLMDEDN